MRSPHALLGLLAVVCLIGTRGGRDFVAVVCIALLALIVLVVAGRYLFKGPEVERARPTLTLIQGGLQQTVEIADVDPEEMSDLIKSAVRWRRPLPLPSGVIKGSSADSNAIQLIDEEEAERLRRKDLQVPSGPTAISPGDKDKPSDS